MPKSEGHFTSPAFDRRLAHFFMLMTAGEERLRSGTGKKKKRGEDEVETLPSEV